MSSRIGSARSKRSVLTPSTRSSDENMPLRRDQSIRSLRQSIHTHRPDSSRQTNSRRSSPAVDGESGVISLKAKGTLRNRLQELRHTGRELMANGMVEDGLAQWGRALKLHANNFAKLKAAIPPLWSASEEYVLIANNTAVSRDMSAAPASSIIPLYQCIIFLLSDEASNTNVTGNKNMSVSMTNDATAHDSDDLFVITPTTNSNKNEATSWSKRQWDRRDKVSYFVNNTELKQVLRSVVLNNIAVHEYISNPAHTLNTLALLMKSLLYSNGVFCTLTLYNLAVIFMSCGRFDDAAEAVARCLELAQLYLTSSQNRMNKLNANTNITNMAASAPASSSSAISLSGQKRKSTVMRAEEESKYVTRGSVVSSGKSKHSISSMYSITGVAASATERWGGTGGNVKVDEEAKDVDHAMCIHNTFIRLIASHIIHCHLLLATLASWSMMPDVAQQHCQLAMMCAEEHLMSSDPLYQVTYHRLRQAILAWRSSVSSSSSSWSNSRSSDIFTILFDTNTPPKLPLIPLGELALSSKVDNATLSVTNKANNIEPIRVSELLHECKGVKVPRELRTYLQAIQRYMRETEESIRERVQIPFMATPTSSTSQTLSRQRPSLRSLLQTEIFGPLLQEVQQQESRNNNVPLFMQSLGLLQMHQQREAQDELYNEEEEEEMLMHTGEQSEESKLQKDGSSSSSTLQNNTITTTSTSKSKENNYKDYENRSYKNNECTIVTRIPDPALHRYKQLKHMTPHYLRQSTLLPPLPVSERNIRDSVTRNTSEVLNLAYLQSASRTRSPRPSMEHSSTMIATRINKLPHESSLSLSHVGAATLPLPNVHLEITSKHKSDSAPHFMRQMDKSLKKFSQLVLDPLPALQIHACQVIQRAWRCAHARQLRRRKARDVEEWLIQCDAAKFIWTCYVNWRSCKMDRAELHKKKRQCAQSQHAVMLSSFINARMSIERKGSRQLTQLVETYERIIEHETQSAAAIVIQSIWRRVMVLHRLQQKRHAVIVLQCNWRVFEAKRELRRRKVHKELEYQAWLQKHYFHIVDIQRWWRACHARIAVHGLLPSKQHAIAEYLLSSSIKYNNTLGSLLYEERLEQKGQLIVALFYGARDRAHMRLLHTAHRIRCRIIHYWVLRHMGFKLLHTLRNEKHDRLNKMKRVEEVEEATLRLQCWCRRWLAQRQCESMRNALVHLHYMACQIQRCYRRYKLQMALTKLSLRARLRKELSEFAFLREHSATIIQATWRMYRVRSEWGLFLEYLSHDRHVYAIRIQRIWRGYYARHVIVPEQVELYQHVTRKRQELLRRLVALIKIQSFCKMCVQRNRFIHLHPQFAHTTLYTLYNNNNINNKGKTGDQEQMDRGNAKRYQPEKVCRSVMYMNHWPSRINVTAAVKRIQRCWRAYNARRRVCSLALARAYGDSQRASHEALHGYATTIQSIVRAKLLNPLQIIQQYRATSHRPRLSDLKQKFYSLPSESLPEEEEHHVTRLASDVAITEINHKNNNACKRNNEKERQTPILTYTTNENSEMSYGNDSSETTTVKKESYPDLIVDESMSIPTTLCVMQGATSHLSHHVTEHDEESSATMKEDSILESDSNLNDMNDVDEQTKM